MLKHDHQDFESNIRTFVKKTISKEDPGNNCFIMCYVLSEYLKIYNIQHTIKSGYISTVTDKIIGHYIITLNNNENTVIDSTEQQIDPANPQVIIQKMNEPYLKFCEIDYKSVFEFFEYPLLHKGKKTQLHAEFLNTLTTEQLKNENKKIDIIPYLRILIRAFYFFKEETLDLEKKGKHYQSNTVNEFFLWVKNIAIQNKDKRGKLNNTLLNIKFDELIS